MRITTVSASFSLHLSDIFHRKMTSIIRNFLNNLHHIFLRKKLYLVTSLYT